MADVVVTLLFFQVTTSEMKPHAAYPMAPTRSSVMMLAVA